MDVFHALFDHELTAVGNGVDVFQFCQQRCQFLFREQPDAFKHRDMSHRAKNIVLSEVKIHFAVFAYGKGFDFLVYLYIFFPKFLSHNAEINKAGRQSQSISCRERPAMVLIPSV